MAVCDSSNDSISISSAKSFREGNAFEALPGHPGSPGLIRSIRHTR